MDDTNATKRKRLQPVSLGNDLNINTNGCSIETQQQQPSTSKSFQQIIEEVANDTKQHLKQFVEEKEEKKEMKELMEEDIDNNKMEEEDVNIQQKAAKIAREYETWKSNAIYLYSFLTTYETSFPYSTTFDWGNIVDRNNNVAKQEFVYGTNGENAFVIKAFTSIPLGTVKPSPFVDGMVGEFDCDDRIDEIALVSHSGDVRRIRTMPQDKNVCVTTSSDGNCYIYNFNETNPQPCKRTAGGGFGICWSNLLLGTFTVCEEGNLHIFNTEVPEGISIKNIHDSINDVCWNSQSEIMLSVGEDGRALITDYRTLKTEIEFKETHEGDANACSFDPNYSTLFITGGGIDGFVRFWDMRKPNQELCHLFGPQDGINCCCLSTINKGFVCTASKDHMVRIYDMSKVGEDQTSNDADDGGSEFLFGHSGHLNEVFDALWNPEIPYVIGTSGDGRDIQFWKPMESLMKEDRTILKPQFLKL
ncbi:WD domain, G-beta repeat containing protein [Entamoeba histolytica HM-1:IMSS-B]|uniref:WD domain containing protein n=5 Tax=Entamoeba histolytica TaxID=5759 RepID=C4M7U1_ENTH1|nr:WD domain containing protein [Entamoeba histolytica HM-1:IMSS]EMH74667.1 WD domain, G-beta repeat containing protein [Entamoeba histolytica HM-1:IMSS-B]EMS16840.1 histone acetyltransferase type B subunit [Entamoeba histolytica HM-3:IMSS]ENY59958.1 histone acetyltransferase type B subunit, putative [Entamoeba histolytica HM-1:IMSS-A]GAT97625.1 WD domain containing protein [Entamoeba histolytica]EAL42966.1 WD domain containing protein [Entamoeba histolytica HM-1:IMSS]|eukprot:XP_648352.1 WD domain containing protein [Entamoeba histolytica HM-1:IMSS]